MGNRVGWNIRTQGYSQGGPERSREGPRKSRYEILFQGLFVAAILNEKGFRLRSGHGVKLSQQKRREGKYYAMEEAPAKVAGHERGTGHQTRKRKRTSDVAGAGD